VSDLQYRPNPLMESVPDLLMMVGKEKYNLYTYVTEALRDGVSKRISLTALVPEMMPGVTNLYLWFPEVIPMVTAKGLGITDLVDDLHKQGLLDKTTLDWAELQEWDPTELLLPDDFVAPGTLKIAMAIQQDPRVRRELEEKYKIQWQGGVFMYSPLGKVRYILKKGETELPEHLRPYAHLIEAVRVIRVNDDGEELEGGEDE
jgi:hypothetical protein